ncbi:putative calcineurin B-likeous protein 1-like [Apostichopus japonicus]|uniref:Putative calcineurin B-likeous protein 1-like n=1 Tax=Stichopus japonicus TaxID=307972 RepID=A0A2G8K1Q1_STIJA|nr:putative calcineurin B-likeous protein 1-like [Apostichopus japonicus]
MGSRTSIPLEDKELSSLCEETKFSHSQLRDLYGRFLELSKDGEFIKRSDMIRLSDLKSNPLGSRIVDAFFKDSCSDDESMDFTQFAKAAAVFKPQRKHTSESALNSADSKLRFIFNIYDLDGDEIISQDEMLSLLKMMVGTSVDAEKLSQIADRAVMDGDDDKDGVIGFEDFKKAVSHIDASKLISIRVLD